ncbi:MAG: hypothetical protein DMG21_04485 [Acidobacteria bacterium]|nr:MAG: hypothetical protein DMG21_04485 [Acidobacteriota bacterium]
MFILKLSLLTCGFYLLFAMVAQTAMVLATWVLGDVYVSRSWLVVFFALAWAVSFGLAWRFLWPRTI